MERLKGAIAVGFLRLFALLPFAVAQRLGAVVGWFMWKLPNRTREVVRINLGHCFPQLPAAEREHLVGETLINIGRSFAESACAWMWDPARTVGLIREVEGEHLLDEALASGKGVVGITSHLGNWEVLNHWYCRKCSPIIFYRPPKQKAVDELLQRQRTQLGNKVAASTREGIISVMREVRKGGGRGYPRRPRAGAQERPVRSIFRGSGADQQVRARAAQGACSPGHLPALRASAGPQRLQGDCRAGPGGVIQ